MCHWEIGYIFNGRLDGLEKIFTVYLSARKPFSFSDLISRSNAFNELANPLKRRYSRIRSSNAWYGAIVLLLIYWLFIY